MAFKGMALLFHFFFFPLFPLIDIETGLVWFLLILYNDAFILILDCQFRLDNASRWICFQISTSLYHRQGKLRTFLGFWKVGIHALSSKITIEYYPIKWNPKKLVLIVFEDLSFRSRCKVEKYLLLFSQLLEEQPVLMETNNRLKINRINKHPVSVL